MSFNLDDGVLQLPALGGRVFYDFKRNYSGHEDMTGKIADVNTRVHYWSSQPENPYWCKILTGNIEDESNAKVTY